MKAPSASLARIAKLLLLSAAGFFAAGCASTLTTQGDDDSAYQPARKALSSMTRDLLSERSLAVRTGSTPSFYADTPGRRTFGILGVMAMVRAGNQLVEDYGLEDPAAHLSENLAAALVSRNGMRTSPADSADLLLDVRTINWDFRPYRNDPDELYVVYSARVSLIDRRAGTVLASGKCRSRRDSSGDSTSLDELLADGARRLQSELREAAQECAQRMKEGTLSVLLDSVPSVAQEWRLQDSGGTIR